jgi:hypothetical protein
MTKFKNYLVQKNIDTLTNLQFDKNAYFRYKDSDAISEFIECCIGRYKKTVIRDILVDLSVTFESLCYQNDSESNHEDLLEVGYLLGLLHATHKGCVYAVEYDSIRFYFVGMETDIVSDIRSEFKKLVKN